MKIGKRIKKLYGHPDEVDFVRFAETPEHIVMLMVSYDAKITHKQVNAVLNKYPLGHWVFVESRLEPNVGPCFRLKYRDRVTLFQDKNCMVSIYRVNKKEAIKVLEFKKSGDILPIVNSSIYDGKYEAAKEVIEASKKT